MGTAKGYTGQYADATGLDYYNARYYDPIVGLFVSADTVQGNEQGMDPYAYVGENPETMVDPSGNMRICSDIASGCSGLSGSGEGAIDFQPPRQNNGGNTGGSGGTMRPTSTTRPITKPRPTSTTRSARPGHTGTGGHRGNPLARSASKSTSPLQDSCQGNLICDAQSDANQGSNEFWMLAGKLALLGAAAETSALLLESFTATVTAIPIIGQAIALPLSAAAALLQTLALTAEGGAILATL